MIFRDAALGNDVHLSAPTSVDAPFDTAPYQLSGVFFGPTAGFDGTVIAPNIVLTAAHVAVGIPIGTTFTAMGVTHTVIEKIPPTANPLDDLTFLKTDGSYPDWAYMWNNEPWTQGGNWLFMVGHGLGRGAYGTDGSFEWWLVDGEPTRARRWGATRPWIIDTNQGVELVVNRFRQDNDPGCFGGTQGDSGSGTFIDAGPNKEWLYIGTVTSAAASTVGTRALWDKPELPSYGIKALTTFKHLPQILSLGGRVLPSQITITKPPEGFVISGGNLLIEGTTVGNPSKITVQLDY